MTHARRRRIFLLSTCASLPLIVGACSLAIDLDGYAGGDAATGDANVDSAVADSVIPDTNFDSSVPDSVIADTSFDSSDADSVTPDTSFDILGADSVIPDTSFDILGADSVIADTSFDSSGADSVIADTSFDSSGADSVIPDASFDSSGADSVIADVEIDAHEAGGGCTGAVTSVGVSEVMPRAVSGSGDAYEWVELTNYGSGCVDVSGLTVAAQSISSGSSHSVAIATGTTLAAGEALVVVDDATKWKAIVATTYTLGQVFEYGAGTTDVFVNSGFHVLLTEKGASTPYETATFTAPSAGFTAGASVAFPADLTGCSTTTRLNADGTTTAAWTTYPTTTATQFGSTGSSTQHGSPTKPNTGVVCP